MMGKPFSDLTFGEWIIFVFDHPVDESRLEWYWVPAADRWEGPAALTVEYLTLAFEKAGTVFQPYSDSQLNQGLWYIVSNACSNHMFALTDTSVPWTERRKCIRSIYTLYEQCFAKRCTPYLSHLDEPGAGPLNPVCYMWWDIIPVFGHPEDPGSRAMDQEILQVLESTLHLDSIPCRESALHGLGHWQLQYPKQAREIINRFLQRSDLLSDNLRAYALGARSGHVL
jgi:hypothetical protein